MPKYYQFFREPKLQCEICDYFYEGWELRYGKTKDGLYLRACKECKEDIKDDPNCAICWF